jgi:hypothetical protein
MLKGNNDSNEDIRKVADVFALMEHLDGGLI